MMGMFRLIGRWIKSTDADLWRGMRIREAEQDIEQYGNVHADWIIDRMIQRGVIDDDQAASAIAIVDHAISEYRGMMIGILRDFDRGVQDRYRAIDPGGSGGTDE